MREIEVGNAPCSWGTIEIPGAQQGERVTYQQMLDELTETGYTGTELGDWGFMPTDPAALRAELEKRHLTMLGAFVGIAFKNPEAHAEGEARALRTARLLAVVASDHKPFVNLADDNGTDPIRTQYAGRVTPEMQLSDREWDVFGRGVERVAGRIQEETGLRVTFHHHCGGYIETPDEIARLMQMTDPKLIGLVFDTGHFVYGTRTTDGGVVSEGLSRFAERIKYIHFKDCEPSVAARARREGWDYNQAVGHGVFCELGKGCVDFPAVLTWLHTRNYRGWVLVEQDVLPGMGTPRENAQRNRDYLRAIGL